MLLLDNSAWARLQRPSLPTGRREQVANWMDTGELWTSLPFLLEAGYSARSASDHDIVLGRLLRLPRVEISAEIEQLAVAAQSDLARSGHHRLAPADLVIAACAHTISAGVLHYDRDYDVLTKHTRLRFASEWLAAPGSLD